jgi:hypothetical protein
VCVSVCGPAPLLGCRPIRVRVSCVSIYCSPPLCNTITFTLLQFIQGIDFTEDLSGSFLFVSFPVIRDDCLKK